MQSIRKVLGSSRGSGAGGTGVDGFSITQGSQAASSLGVDGYTQHQGSKLIGAKASDFVDGTTLGTGTFGRVRLVEYTGHEEDESKVSRVYAMKTLKKTEILRLKQVEHVKNEVLLLNELDHPFIVNMTTFFQDESRIFMVLEYVPGGELFTYLRNEVSVQNSEANFFASQVVLAFGYLHHLGIAYRDLKPENLLITRTGYLKIADFGFAKKIKDRTFTLCGTPEYLAPEIIQSKGHGCPVDWWALGVLIYEMLVGCPPFYAESSIGIYQRILHGVVDYPTYMDPNATALIKKLLQADLTKRIGCLKNGVLDITRSKWFSATDFKAIFEGRVQASYVPTVADETDTSNFDKYPDSPPGSLRTPTKSEAARFDEFDQILERVDSMASSTQGGQSAQGSVAKALIATTAADVEESKV
ncbi:Protein kinase DC2 [Hondaea fermentalgiana]|uniref:Protein kinase DC2 n=1 Tax=Hondaea fermentalgiana TaxID=2315210 RepID=A0A2R5GTG4_9STRA|nr:Protein kinase DC2 [Hondaea fermentalgiana]|eukprot:GBG31943.1 Protein kinase DC2 [Hondaea fermentalgiana]